MNKWLFRSHLDLSSSVPLSLTTLCHQSSPINSMNSGRTSVAARTPENYTFWGALVVDRYRLVSSRTKKGKNGSSKNHTQIKRTCKWPLPHSHSTSTAKNKLQNGSPERANSHFFWMHTTTTRKLKTVLNLSMCLRRINVHGVHMKMNQLNVCWIVDIMNKQMK